MAPVVVDSLDARDSTIALLNGHLPQALSLQRRLHFMRFPGGSTEHSHVLFCTDPEKPWGAGDAPRHFAAAYLDFSRAPETPMWLYSTLEEDSTLSEAEVQEVLDLVYAILRHVKAEAARYPGKLHRENGVMIGGLHEGTRQLLLARGITTETYYNPHDKWLFQVSELPTGLKSPLADDMKWDTVRREDCDLIVSSTKVPKAERTLLTLPSTVLRLGDGTPISWGFLGVDGTLSTLHCEVPWRGRGIAKAVAIKTIQEHSKDFADDGWASADVHPDNLQSQGVCRSIGGKKAWRNAWTVVDYASIADSS